MSLVVDLPGVSVRVGVGDLERVGAGGEGSVYLLRHHLGTFAIKRYHQPTQGRLEKLKATIAARPANAVFGEGNDAIVQMAWPLGLVKENGAPVGFVMPYVDTKKAMELDYFISPVLANDVRHLERPNLAVRLQIAQNLCSVINSLHEAGHHFIDFKPQNIKVYPRSLHVCLIDCDSFSVSYNGRRFPASAYSPQFINPIALVNDQPPSGLGENQDNWAIAVALFMLFNFDLHPYDGRASSSVTVTTVDDFVRMGLYAYGSNPHPLVAPKPASVHGLWPTELRALFDRAFTDPQRAPAMLEWVQYFRGVLQNKLISRCDAMPNAVDHLRFSGHGCMQCAFERRQRRRVTAPQKVKRKSTEPPVAAQANSVAISSSPSPSYNIPLPTQKKMSDGAKTVWGLLIFFLLVWLFNDTPERRIQATAPPPHTANPSPIAAPQAPERPIQTTPPLPHTANSSSQAFYFYNLLLKKPTGLSTSLTTEETRWCAFQDYRISYLKEMVRRELFETQIQEFNNLCVNKDFSLDVLEAIKVKELSDPGLQQALQRRADLE